MTYTNSSQRQIPIMPFMHIPRNVFSNAETAAIHAIERKEQRILEVQSESKKIKWGEPFWNLFHVLAEKVNENDFLRIRVDFLNIIYTICSNLPCPDCTNHAVHYLNGVNFNTIKTKDDLKTLFFNFHNSVNARKGYPIFQRGDLDAKYKSGNLLAIIENFLMHFKTRPYSVKLFTETLHRDRITKTLIAWFRSNLSCFQ